MNQLKKILLLLCGVALSMTACGKASSAESVLRIGVMYSADIVPLVVLMDQGLDGSQGFQLDMTVFASAKDRDAALQAGELDGVFTDLIGMCVYRNAGLPVKIKGCTDGNDVLVACYRISSLEMCAGKKVAVSENTLIEYAFDTIAGPNNGMEKVIVPRIPDRLEMLRAGKIDVCVLPEPFDQLAVQAGATVLGSANQCGLYPAVSAFTESALEQKPHAIQQFYIAYNQAVDMVNNRSVPNLQEILFEKAGFPKELPADFSLPYYRTSAPPDKEAIQDAIDWASQKGLCSPELRPDTLL